MATSQQRFSAEDRRQQILEVARGLFARKGYAGTTTREIALAAKVNEAIVFRHFPTKEELYWAVMDSTCRTTGVRDRFRERVAQGGTVRDILVDVARQTLERRAKDQTFTRLLFFSALENHELSHRFFTNFVAGYYEALAEFIQEQIDAGNLRRTDPLLAARCFLGMVIYHSLVQNLFGATKTQPMSDDKVAEFIVDLWLKGMLPDQDEERDRAEIVGGRVRRKS